MFILYAFQNVRVGIDLERWSMKELEQVTLIKVSMLRLAVNV